MLAVMTEANYTVTGMSCGHCARSVTAELTELRGVTGVSVDISTGRVTVASENPLSHVDVRTAVEEAGYELAVPVS
jgi:copper chaperone